MPKELTDIDRQLGARLRQKRLELGLTQSDIAQALGVSFQQVQKFEKGKNRINAAQLARVAERLGASLADLYGEAAPQPGFAEAPQRPFQAQPAPDPALTAQAMALHAAFLRISDPALRRSIVDLTVQIAGRERSD